VFARTWYPGLVARLNGRPIEVSRYRYDLVRVKLPNVRSGVLELYWGYPALVSAWIAIAASLLTIVLGFWATGARRASVVAEPDVIAA
jgi:hypothetical protein